MAPGAHFATKRLPAEKFVEVIHILKKRLDAKFAFFGGVADRKICGDIILKSGIDAEDYSGSASIVETARNIDKCNILLTNDTGVMHIAAARQVPVVAIFGSWIIGAIVLY